MNHLIIFGCPGSGKGTQAEKISQEFKLKHLSVGKLFRQAIRKRHPLASKLKTIMSKGALVSDKIVNKTVKDELTKSHKKTFIFDGYPRNLAQARFLDRLIDPKKINVLNLAISKKEMLDRLSLRKRDDDDPENVARRWRTYRQEAKPLLDYYRQSKRLKRVKGEGSIEEVFNRLKEAIES